MNLPEKAIGYQTSLFSFFPLPRTNVGKTFERSINGVSCFYADALGIPHTTLDRRWIEIVTTKAKQSGDAHVEFESVCRELARYGMERDGRYILPARKALYRFGNLQIHTEAVEKVKGGMEMHRALNFAIADKVEVFWGSGRADLAPPELFDGHNYMNLSKTFMDFVDRAAPHVQDHYMQIQSPLTLDVYDWLVKKLYSLDQASELIRWPWLYAQFGQTGGILNPNQMKNLRRLIKTSLLDIVQNYYTAARAEVTDEGIILKKSPPLIAPDNKKAGFAVL